MATQEDHDSSRGSLPRHSDSLKDSEETLGDQNHDREIDGGEKGEDSGPPQPVGFWDKSLRKTRLQVYGRWSIMSKQAMIRGNECQLNNAETIHSFDTGRIYPRILVNVLGCPISCRAEHLFLSGIRRRFRRPNCSLYICHTSSGPNDYEKDGGIATVPRASLGICDHATLEFQQ